MTTKHPELLSDREIRSTPTFQQLADQFGELHQANVLSLAKQALVAKWEQGQEERLKQAIATLDDILSELGVDANIVQIHRNEGTYEAVWPKAKRWRPRDYVAHINRSFSRTSQSHDPLRRGTYTLYINEPLRNSREPISAKLVCPRRFELRFPPRDPKKPRKGRNYEEVSSMSALMRRSPLKSALSPAQYFDLGERPERDEE